MLKSGKNFNISTGTIQVHWKILLIQENKKLLFKQGQLHDTIQYPEVWREGICSTYSYINTFFHRCVKIPFLYNVKRSKRMSLNDKKYFIHERKTNKNAFMAVCNESFFLFYVMTAVGWSIFK
jgi:hypothetical protein